MNHNINLPLPDATCDKEDILECEVCSSEKVCAECQYGKVLIGKSNEYYGRCVCPVNYYKFGFTTTTCNKTEYIKEAWQQF